MNTFFLGYISCLERASLLYPCPKTIPKSSTQARGGKISIETAVSVKPVEGILIALHLLIPPPSQSTDKSGPSH
jgi:hypothetical protein